MNERDLVGKIAGPIILMMAFVTITAMLPTVTSYLNTLAGGSKPEAAPADPAPQPEADAPTDWTWLKYVGIGLAIALVLALLVFVAHRITTRRQRARNAADAAREVRAAQIERWGKGRAAYEHVALGITAFETDPETIFIRPLLLDTTEPATAALFDTFDEVGKLHLENVPRDETLITTYVDAALAAKRAFDRADQDARAKAREGITSGNRRLTATEARNLVRAKGLLKVALDPSTESAHARNAYRKVTELLAGVITIPEKFENQVVRSIDAVHRLELTTGTPDLAKER